VTLFCTESVPTEFSPKSGKDIPRLLQPEDVAHVVEMLVTQSERSFASEVQVRPLRKP